MKNDFTEIFKERVLRSAQSHENEIDPIKIFLNVFNLKKGMSLAEVESILNSQASVLGDDFYSLCPSAVVNGFNSIYVWLNEDKGLYAVYAVNEDIEAEGFALPLKKKFYELEKIFEIKYGKYNHKEETLEDIENHYNDWTVALEMGKVSLETVFNEESGSTMSNDLKQILIGASKEQNSKANIVVVYKFDNCCD